MFKSKIRHKVTRAFFKGFYVGVVARGLDVSADYKLAIKTLNRA